MIKITLENKILYAEKGERLSDVFMRYGIDAPHPCAGKGSCKKCRVNVDGEEKLSCSYILDHDVTVLLPKSGTYDVKFFGNIEKFNASELFFALDLGTTTLSLALVAKSGEKLCQVNAANPQAVFGGDVISRIAYCQSHGAKALQTVIVKRINEMINVIGTHAHCLYVAGNVTMLHLLLGVDCSSIGVAPYNASFLERQEFSAKELSIENLETVITLPSSHSFVGADVIAGLGYLNPPESGKYSIFLDLGTNAELILFSKDRIVCTAAAAGPCFEGANISCGKSAIGGAISAFAFRSGRAEITTISGGEPDGICATGLIDTVAGLLDAEIIDESGYMDKDFHFTDNVYLSQGDVRELQLAKSAVCSAIEALMSVESISYDHIEHLYVSGGFSQKLSPASAAVVGLIPRELTKKYLSIGNSALEGAIRYVTEATPLDEIAKKAKYTDLTQNKVFNTRFIENMSF